MFLGQPPSGDCQRMTLSAMARAPAEAYHSGFWRRIALLQRDLHAGARSIGAAISTKASSRAETESCSRSIHVLFRS